MPESDRVYDILIRFGVEPEAARAAVTELQNLKSETGKAADATEDLTKQTGKTVEATEKATVSKRDLRTMIKSVGHEFPLLGAAGRIALNPFVAGITLAIGGLTSLRNQISNTLAALDSPKWGGNAEGIRAAATAMDDAAIAAHSFWHELNQIQTQVDVIKKGSAEMVASIHKEAGFQSELRAAQKANDLARISAAEKTNAINAKQAGQLRAQIEDKYAILGRQDKTQAEQKEFDALNQEVKRLQALLPKVEEKVKNAQAAAAKATANDTKTDDEVKKLKDDITEADKGIAAQNKENEDRIGFRASTTFDALSQKYVDESLQSYVETRAVLQRRLNQLEDGRVKRLEKNNDIRADASAAEQELKATRATEQEVRDKSNLMYREMPKDNAHRQQVDNLNSQTRQIEQLNTVPLFNATDSLIRNLTTWMGIVEKGFEGTNAELRKTNARMNHIFNQPH